MAKPGKIPDFRKIYPEASEEVIEVLKKTERKMQYQEFDLKTERTVSDWEDESVRIISSREDSLERLLEQDVQFGDNSTNVEENAIRNLEFRELHKALSLLTDDERYLIEQLYYYERTEQEIAEELGVYHNAIHKKKLLILRKLKSFL